MFDEKPYFKDRKYETRQPFPFHSIVEKNPSQLRRSLILYTDILTALHSKGTLTKHNVDKQTLYQYQTFRYNGNKIMYLLMSGNAAYVSSGSAYNSLLLSLTLCVHFSFSAPHPSIFHSDVFIRLLPDHL